MDIQMFLIPQQLKTYSRMLTIAREVEQGLKKKNRNQIQNETMKRSFQQMSKGNLDRYVSASMVAQLLQPIPHQIICPPSHKIACRYCHKLGHTRRNCQRTNRLYLAWGSSNHPLEEYTHMRSGNNTTTIPVLPAPPVIGNSGLVRRGIPHSPQ